MAPEHHAARRAAVRPAFPQPAAAELHGSGPVAASSARPGPLSCRCVTARCGDSRCQGGGRILPARGRPTVRGTADGRARLPPAVRSKSTHQLYWRPTLPSGGIAGRSLVPRRRSRQNLLSRVGGASGLPHRASISRPALPVCGSSADPHRTRSADAYTGTTTGHADRSCLIRTNLGASVMPRSRKPRAWLGPRVSSDTSRYRPPLLEPLAQAPLRTACLWLTSRAVSSVATETPFINLARRHPRVQRPHARRARSSRTAPSVSDRPAHRSHPRRGQRSTLPTRARRRHHGGTPNACVNGPHRTTRVLGQVRSRRRPHSRGRTDAPLVNGHGRQPQSMTNQDLPLHCPRCGEHRDVRSHSAR